MFEELYDIPNYENWEVIKKIAAGWSEDTKFYIEDNEENKYLLRLSDISEYDNKINEFEFIRTCNSLEFKMSKALNLGICNNNKNVYMLLSWVEGETLSYGLRNINSREQYELGLEAGKILNEIHSLEIEPEKNLIPNNKKNKILENLIKYENSINRVDKDQVAIDFVRSNIEKINTLSPVYKHGDYHVGNLIFTPQNTIGVIDFNRWEYGDRYEEFQRIQSFDVEVSIPFSIGKIHGYFDGEPTLEFWNKLAIYVAYTALYSIVWAEKFGEEDINGMKKRCIDTLDDYNDFNTMIPKWYKPISNVYTSFRGVWRGKIAE